MHGQPSETKPATEDDVARVQASYDAFNRRDLDAIVAIAGPAMEAYERAESPEQGVAHGREGMAEAIETLHEEFEDYRLDPIQIERVGDYLLVVVRQSGRGRASGIPVEEELIHLIERSADGLSRLRAFSTRAEALEAAGLG
jgi:ketosteroid isomerase-like protein